MEIKLFERGNAVFQTMCRCMGLLVACLALSSCSSNALIFGVTDLGRHNETVPEERSAKLIIPEHSKVTHFNGTPVTWNEGQFLPNAMIRIPTGEHVIKYELHARGVDSCSSYQEPVRGAYGTTMVTRKNCSPRYYHESDEKVTFTFDAGKVYLIRGKTIVPYTDGRYGKW